MSDEYISREEMIDAVDHLHIIPSIDGTGKPTSSEDFRVQFIGTVLKVKSADVVPVRHGKWMKEDRGHVEYCAVCDQCGFDWMWSDRGYFKFCPNCGAKMDGGDEHG